jgi:2-polyprenyl-6-methoxyphenol hydroxylase-like FAD-dependent oxidoreductase
MRFEPKFELRRLKVNEGTVGVKRVDTRCCIVGGGPAGMMLGYLLARAGTDVLVLEKHSDFLRDFRGDTIHPSTLDLLHELGLLEKFLKRPHDEVRRLTGWIGDSHLRIADFNHLPTHCKFVAFMPQWDFLNFFAEEAKRYPSFRLLMNTEATDLLVEDGLVTGVRAKSTQGQLAIRADLTIAADGRHSIIRQRAGLEVINLGAPMDVLWMHISRAESDPPITLGRVDAGRILVLLNRGTYWQCALVIPKGSYEELRARGLPAFRAQLAELATFLGDRVEELADWEQIKLLTVMVDRLKRWWRPGLLCIGDAAHAMSPIGGVGINLAIQDAVAAANILAKPLRMRAAHHNELSRVQRRREFATRATQRMQIAIQNNVIKRVLGSTRIRAPWVLKLVDRWPLLQRIPARLIGIGFRPEHVKTPEAQPMR